MAYSGGVNKEYQQQKLYEKAADYYNTLRESGLSDVEARNALEENYKWLQSDIRLIENVMDAYHKKYGGTSLDELEEKAEESLEESEEKNYSTEETNKNLLNDMGVNSTVTEKSEDNGVTDGLKEAAETSETSEYSTAQDMAEYLDAQNKKTYEDQMGVALEGLQEAYDNGNDTTTLLGDYEQNVNDILAGMDSTENAAFNYGDYQNGLSSKVAEEVARSVGDTKLSNTTYDATRGTTAANYNNAVNQAISAANVANQGYKNMADLNQNTTDTAKTVADDLTAYKADMADSEYNAANSLRRSALNGYEEDDPLKTADTTLKAVKSGLDAGTTVASMFNNGNT